MTKSSRGVLSSVPRRCARQVCSVLTAIVTFRDSQKQQVGDRMNLIALGSLDSAQQHSKRSFGHWPQTMICARCLVY